ncbi:MAG: response regulator transcription factor, partial [Actinomycetes bacterium]
MTRPDEAARAADGGEPIRVLIVDDHALIRRSLELALTAEPDIEVVGEASDGEEAVELAGRLMPDVVLMDVRMPRRTGIEATRGIKEAVPSARIIMLTVSDEEEDLFDAIKAGATGYLLKDVQIDEVPDAVRSVYEGQSLINPSMATKLIQEFAAMSRKEAERPP